MPLLLLPLLPPPPPLPLPLLKSPALAAYRIPKPIIERNNIYF
ncbi:hypothetical protein B2J93_2489 [Marssonina coronariae]|uniref:Uncharacterized protein n=1 Tax=Diplocarpon coronariae TaxID=2795749 RepID=A0A218ZDU1_9HELO|nr:hypothetical protein B2J93_2489 [Marssonina coronariae]